MGDERRTQVDRGETPTGSKIARLNTLIAFRVGQSCFFIYGFAKNDAANVTKKALEALQDYATLLLSYDAQERAQSVARGELLELEVDGGPKES